MSLKYFGKSSAAALQKAQLEPYCELTYEKTWKSMKDYESNSLLADNKIETSIKDLLQRETTVSKLLP